MILYNPAQAAEAAFRAPVKCENSLILGKTGVKVSRPASCGYERSLAAARTSYKRLLEARNKCSDPVNLRSCGPLHAYTVAYPPCNEGQKTLGEPDFFAPVSALSNGSKALQSVLEHAKSGVPFEGRYQIVETDNSTANEQHLALCDVRVVAGLATQPRDCETVAIVTPTESWLRGQVGLQTTRFGKGPFSCFASTTIRLSGAIDVTWTVQAKPDPLAIADAVKTMLDGELKLFPSLTVEKNPNGETRSIYISSAAPLRNSLILTGGWREAIDFDVNFFLRKDEVVVRGTVHASVSRTAVGSLTQYQGTDDAQRAQYAEAFNSHVLAAIKSACKNASVIDNSTVLCQPPTQDSIK